MRNDGSPDREFIDPVVLKERLERAESLVPKIAKGKTAIQALTWFHQCALVQDAKGHPHQPINPETIEFYEIRQRLGSAVTGASIAQVYIEKAADAYREEILELAIHYAQNDYNAFAELMKEEIE